MFLIQYLLCIQLFYAPNQFIRVVQGHKVNMAAVPSSKRLTIVIIMIIAIAIKLCGKDTQMMILTLFV